MNRVLASLGAFYFYHYYNLWGQIYVADSVTTEFGGKSNHDRSYVTVAGERQIKGHQSDFKTFTLLDGIHQQFVNMSASGELVLTINIQPLLSTCNWIALNISYYFIFFIYIKLATISWLRNWLFSYSLA